MSAGLSWVALALWILAVAFKINRTRFAWDYSIPLGAVGTAVGILAVLARAVESVLLWGGA